jgi:DNA polymerase I-like protein with 3'-5' exonuclease and polymerase domains
MFPSLVADVGKVVAEATPWTEPDYDVLDGVEEAVAFLQELSKTDRDIYVDIECDIEKDTAYDHPDRYDMLCVGIGLYDENGDIERIVVIGYEALQSDAVWDAMEEAFNVGKLEAHNGKFDLAALFPHVGPLELRFDTMLASYALDERPGIHGLKYHAQEDFGAPAYDDAVKKYAADKKGYGVIPKPVLYKYNAYDIAAGMRLKKKQLKLLDTKEPSWWGKDKYTARYDYKSLRSLVDFLVEYGSNSLMYLELNGIKIDREYNRELHVQYGDRMDAIKKRINEVLARTDYDPINPNSPLQVRTALRHLRIRVESTDKDTVNKIIDMTRDKPEFKDAFDFCEILLEWRREAKLFGTYVKGVTKRLYKGRIYSTFSLHGTVTGRLASRNPNLQNIVRESHIKKQYIPGKPENVFVSCDYGQAELRVVTWMTDCQFFRDLFLNPDRDFFDELTPRLYPGKTLDLVGSEITKAEWKELRIRVKAFVYGLNYGRTEFSIAQELKMATSEASAVKKNFFATIPEIVEWQNWVQAHVKSGKDLISPFGRHRRYHLITEENWDDIKKEALAFLPQSTSSDLCLRAMARVRRDLRGTGAFVRNIVHDNIMVDCHPSIADDVSALVSGHMVESARELVGDYVPFTVDTSIGKNWGELS